MAAERVVDAADIVEHLAVGRGVERVHREVPPARVLGPVRAEGDDGVAPVRPDVTAQSRDFEHAIAGNGGHGAMIEPGGERLDIGARQSLHRDFGLERRRDVDIGDVEAHQRIAHRAAYEAHVVLAERAHDRARVRRRQPWIAVAFEPHARAASRSPKFTSIAAVAPQM
jgi:hypothetical protein